MDTYVVLKQLGEVREEKWLCAFLRSDYELNIVYFGREKSKAFLPDTMKFPIPDFVVGILSDSTECRDRGVKFKDCEAHGVREYWIVDAETETIVQYVVEDNSFRLRLKSGSGDIVSQVIHGFRIPI